MGIDDRFTGPAPLPSAFPPFVWGNLIWSFGRMNGRPAEPHEPATYWSIVRLARLAGEQPKLESEGTPAAWFADGDSDYELGSITDFSKSFENGRTMSVAFLPNASGRLAALKLTIDGATSMFDAYEATQGFLNYLSVKLASTHHVPIRSCAIRICSCDEASDAVLIDCPYPHQEIAYFPNVPILLERLYSRYIDALRSGSPAYSIVVLYKLNWLMIYPLQTYLRTLAANYENLNYINLTGSFSPPSVARADASIAGRRYTKVLRDLKPLRDQIVHAILGNGFRPFNTSSEDYSSRKRDALRIMALDLLFKTRDNIRAFERAGLDERSLFENIEQEFHTANTCSRGGTL